MSAGVGPRRPVQRAGWDLLDEHLLDDVPRHATGDALPWPEKHIAGAVECRVKGLDASAVSFEQSVGLACLW